MDGCMPVTAQVWGQNAIPVSRQIGWISGIVHALCPPDPPMLIVTSRLADDYLWAEALNLGAYDVLAKPFDASEVSSSNYCIPSAPP
jgi:CheY-like chemotaxis protein